LVGDHPELNKQMASIYLAIAILDNFLGDDWLKKFVLPGAKVKNVLTQTESDPTSDATEQLRLVDLAEVMFNLQPVPGFTNCIARLQQGDIEGTLAELDLGRMLFINGVPLRYVIPEGTKGTDYDMVVQFKNGQYGCVDAKCKVEGSSFSQLL
jgi:hypothetical protein